MSDCPVCLEPIETPLRTECGHFYHFECIRRWARVNPTCPVCRADLVIPDPLSGWELCVVSLVGMGSLALGLVYYYLK
jgi:hypothetical protein